MVRIGFAPRWVPEVMGDKLKEQRLGRRPGKGAASRGMRPGFEIAEIGGQRPQRIGALWSFLH